MTVTLTNSRLSRVLLRDGTPALIRALEPADAPAIRRLHAESSTLSNYRRFFVAGTGAAEAYVSRLFSGAGPADALVALVEGRLVAVATSESDGDDAAEVALFVADAYQGRGLATMLLERIATAVRSRGVPTIRADILSDNAEMIGVFRDAGFDLLSWSSRNGVVEMSMSTQLTERVRAATDGREREAERHFVHALLSPRSIVVIGAGRRRGGVGREVLENIKAAGYTGRTYVVHPSATQVGGVAAYSSVAAVPDAIDLAVVAVPKDAVTKVVREASSAGVRVAVILTSGLAEAGADGRAMQDDIVEIALRNGMRIVGPNCLGVLNTDPSVRLNATFASVTPLPGRLAIASQSGGVGVALLDEATRCGVGVGPFVSLGNKADVSGNDLIAAWTDDDGVRVAALYLESIGNPEKFARLARRFGEDKPLLAVVGGLHEEGRRAGTTHTSASVTSEATVNALFAQCGVIPVDGITDLVSTARTLLEQPLPAGPRLGIIGNAGGLGVLAADYAHLEGLTVPAFSRSLRSSLADAASGAPAVANPVDLGPAASPEGWARCVRACVDSGEVDSVLVHCTETSVGHVSSALIAVREALRAGSDVPVTVVVAGASCPPGVDLAVMPSPEQAVRSLAHALRYSSWRRRPHVEATSIRDVDVGGARSLVHDVLARRPDGDWLCYEEIDALFGSYGLRLAGGRVVQGPECVVETADDVGFPVVLKSAERGTVHKTEHGLVMTGIDDREAVQRAALRLVADSGRRILVQRQISGGIEMAVGAVREGAYPPLIMIGAGGTATEVLDDRAFLMPPVSGPDVTRALVALRVSHLLHGYRGAAAVDLDALIDVVVRVARMTDDLPQIAELDINPVIATPEAAHCVDVRIRVAPGSTSS